jgi:hypothetical protein
LTSVNSEPPPSGQLLPETAGGAFGALIGAWVGTGLAGPFGAATGLAAGSVVGAGIVPVLERWFSRIQGEFGRRGRVVVEAAGSRGDMTPDEVLERLLDADDLQPLMTRILDAAARTDSVLNLRILGTVLGEALSDRPREVDDYILIATAVNDLGPAHVRVLELLEGPADPTDADRRWTAGEIEERIGSVSPLGTQAALGGLVRHGLVQNDAGFGLTYSLTKFGHALLDLIRLIDRETA